VKKFNDLTKTELRILYQNFVLYRDKFCNGCAKMDVWKFYKKYGFEEYPGN